MKLHASFLSCIGTLVLVLGSLNLKAQPTTPRDSTWVTNGTVYAVAYSKGVAYIGGDFSYVGPNTWHGSALSTSTGQADLRYLSARVNGTIYAVASDASGNWYVGGDFTVAGGLTRNRIAKIRTDGTVDPTWNPNVTGGGWPDYRYINALAVSGSIVYVGGRFSGVGGQSRNNLAAVDATTGNASSWNPNPNGTIHSIAVSGSVVYVGGEFTESPWGPSIGGQQRNRLAALDATTGSATAWNPNANATVLALAVSGSTVYAGGEFTSIGGQVRNYFAAIDASTGNVTSSNPNPNARVRTAVVSGSTIYVGGDFLSIGGQIRNYIAAVDASSGVVTAWNPNANGIVRSIRIGASAIYAAGSFTSVGGQIRHRLAALDLGTGNASSWTAHAPSDVYSLAVSGSLIYAGGAFRSIGGQLRNRLAAVDLVSTGATAWNPDAGGKVLALAIHGSTVYVGGEFTTISGQTRNRLAAFDLSTGTLRTWNPNANNGVRTIVGSGSILYVGGWFSTISGQTRRYIAALDTSTGFPSGWNPNANYDVLDIKVSGSTVFVAGWFSSIGGQTRYGIAAIDAATGSATSWNANIDSWDNDVYSVEIRGLTLFMGGTFTSIGGQPRNRLASVDVNTGSPTGWNPNSNGIVEKVRILGDTVYVAGQFTNIGGYTRNYVASIHAITGIPTGWSPSAGPVDWPNYGHVYDLLVTRSFVLATGKFTEMGGKFQDYFAQFGNVPVNPIPTISSISPAAGNRLQTLNVTINGSGFISGETSVSFGSEITVNSVTVNSSTQIIANITIAATAATGARSVSATNGPPGGGTGTLSSAFTVINPAPTFTSASPNNGNRLQTLNVTVVGNNFISGVTTVDFGAGITVNSLTFTGSTQLTANITIASTAATGARTVSITNAPPAGGTVTFTFTVNNPEPTFTSASPTSGTRLQTLNVTVIGGNFISGVTTVNFGTGITVNSLTFTGSTQLTANITIASTAATEARTVSITNAPPAGGTVTFTFTVNNPEPTLTRISPTNGERLQVLNVGFKGTNFISGVSTANVGAGITINSTTVHTSDSLTVNIMIGANATTGARNFSVTNSSPGGGTSGNQTFSINNPVPTLTSISPNTGNRLDTLYVTFRGTNFISGTSSVNVGNGITVIPPLTVSGDTSLTARITITASADTGARSFSVSNATPGGGTSTAQTFRVNNPAPTLASISPTSGTRGQTLNVNFTGSNFISSVSSVNVGTGITVNSTTVNNSTSLTANITISALADTGARNFSVTNATPGGGTSGSVTFRVVNNPPSAVRLVQPANGDTVKLTIPSVPLVFRWRRSVDPDPSDTVKYTLRMTGVSIDTIMSNISDTTASLDIMSRLQVASIYSWTVNATDGFTSVVSPDTFRFRTSDTITSVSSLYSVIPKEYQLHQNYPNPFNPTTSIRYGLPARSVVRLAIYNLLGQVVSELVDGEKETGYHEVQWQAESSSGMYFYRLEATQVDDASKRFVEVKKMVLLR